MIQARFLFIMLLSIRLYHSENGLVHSLCIVSASKLQVNRRLFQKNPNNYATRSPLTMTKNRLNSAKIMQWCTA